MKRFLIKSVVLMVMAVVAFGSFNALAGEKERLRDKSKELFAVYYNENGEVVKVELTEYAEKTCKVRAKGKELTTKKIAEIISKHSHVEIIDGSIVHCYGSPDCWIWIGGYPICICCY